MFEFINSILNFIGIRYIIYDCMDYMDCMDCMDYDDIELESELELESGLEFELESESDDIKSDQISFDYICPICSYNIANTRCYELECINYGKEILVEF